MKKNLFILFVQISLQMYSAVEKDRSEMYFPTGMTWKEVFATPGVPLDTVAANVYEIGGDTLIGAILYKEVFRNGEKCQLWIREQDQIIWILTNDYPSEIKLYDFDWDSSDFELEVIEEKEGGMVLSTFPVDVNSAKTAYIDSKSFEYITDGCRTIIRGIGCVSELNRDACMLGYKLPEIILPGMIYCKVLWVCRDGKRVFSSDDSNEWIDTFPLDQGIRQFFYTNRGEISYYNLMGRKVAHPTRGIYIKDGRKVVIKSEE